MNFAKLCAERYSLRKFDTRPVERKSWICFEAAGMPLPPTINSPSAFLCCRAQRRWKRRMPAWAVISIHR